MVMVMLVIDDDCERNGGDDGGGEGGLTAEDRHINSSGFLAGIILGKECVLHY